MNIKMKIFLHFLVFTVLYLSFTIIGALILDDNETHVRLYMIINLLTSVFITYFGFSKAHFKEHMSIFAVHWIGFLTAVMFKTIIQIIDGNFSLSIVGLIIINLIFIFNSND